MKQTVRFFAIGLFTAAILMFGYFSLFNQQSAVENAPVEELIAQVEDEGYRVITEEEFITFSLLDLDDIDVKQDKAEKEQEKEKPKKEDKEDTAKKEKDNKDTETKKDDSKKEEKKPKKVTITTNQGVVTEDIADMLYDKKVIKDKRKFMDFLEDNDYSPYIQIGTFEIKTDMTFKEIAEVITTYPGSN